MTPSFCFKSRAKSQQEAADALRCAIEVVQLHLECVSALILRHNSEHVKCHLLALAQMFIEQRKRDAQHLRIFGYLCRARISPLIKNSTLSDGIAACKYCQIYFFTLIGRVKQPDPSIEDDVKEFRFFILDKEKCSFLILTDARGIAELI